MKLYHYTPAYKLGTIMRDKKLHKSTIHDHGIVWLSSNSTMERTACRPSPSMVKRFGGLWHTMGRVVIDVHNPIPFAKLPIKNKKQLSRGGNGNSKEWYGVLDDLLLNDETVFEYRVNGEWIPFVDFTDGVTVTGAGNEVHLEWKDRS